jgi:sulfatase modifying factor 1
MTSEPSTYRRIVLQEAKLQKLEELDVFEELADIDYLSNLKTKVADTVNGLLSKGLIPDNFKDLFNADFKRVCSIRKIFSMKSDSFGARLDEIEKLRKELYSFEKSDLWNFQQKLTDFEKLWNKVYPKISRLHYAPDWSSSGSLETYLNEYYMLENNDDFLTNVSKALLLFIRSPTELEAKIKDKITDFREFITKCQEEHEQAKLKEPEIKKLCDEGKLKSLIKNIDQVKRFKDIALYEKKQLVIFDRLVEKKKNIDQKLSSISKDSNKKTSKKQLEQLKTLEVKAKQLLVQSGSLSHGLSLCLAAQKTKEQMSKVEKTIKRKRQLSYLPVAFFSLITVGIFAFLFNHLLEQARLRALELAEQERQWKLAKPARTKAAYEKLGDKFTVPDLDIEMIWVEPGTFTMGQSDISYASEHEVTLTNGFYLGKYEVTQSQYLAVMNMYELNPSKFEGDNRPVERVSWYDAVEFCDKLTEIERKAGRLPEGMVYSLPTEAQWEYACRAGTTTAYSWGDSITTDNAHYFDSQGSDTRDVGSYGANPWGFFDMHGNVLEWTADAWGTYASGAQADPEGPATGADRVLRGGSWDYTGPYLRSAIRFKKAPSYCLSNMGFRVGAQLQ